MTASDWAWLLWFVASVFAMLPFFFAVWPYRTMWSRGRNVTFRLLMLLEWSIGRGFTFHARSLIEHNHVDMARKTDLMLILASVAFSVPLWLVVRRQIQLFKSRQIAVEPSRVLSLD